MVIDETSDALNLLFLRIFENIFGLNFFENKADDINLKCYRFPFLLFKMIVMGMKLRRREEMFSFILNNILASTSIVFINSTLAYVRAMELEKVDNEWNQTS